MVGINMILLSAFFEFTKQIGFESKSSYSTLALHKTS